MQEFYNHIHDLEIPLVEIVIRFVLSAAVGVLIGYNRQLKYRSAGLRTFTLITLGSTMVMLVSTYVPWLVGDGDRTRIAAQAVTGIGFLGAGAIIRGRGDNVMGLTTAACIWVCSAIGLGIGAGLYLPSIILAAMVLFTLYALSKFETKVGLFHRSVHIELQTDVALPDTESIKKVLKEMEVVVVALNTESLIKENKATIYIEGKLKQQRLRPEIIKHLSVLEHITAIKSDL